jgi:putative addiction module component (TIGR02574 family)
MSAFDRVKDEALELSLKERAELAKQLLESVDNPSEAELEELWLEEVGERITRVERGESRLVPLEEVLARAKAALGGNVAKRAG